MKLNKINIFFLFLISLFGCNSDKNQKLDNKNWSLAWSDEFNTPAGTLPDATKWSFDIGNGTNGWGNRELEYYTNNPSNIATDGNGNLVITAKKETIQGYSYSSARIKTKNLFDQTYGKFEARLITPYGQGLWPAFWLLGSNVDTVGWPNCGEIDIMEMRGQQPSIMQGTLHGPGYSGSNPISGSYALANDRFDSNYHIFGIEWDKDKIDFFVDGYLYNRIDKTKVTGQWVFDHSFFMILNVAVGGDYLGSPNTTTTFPQKMIVDYVRVYQ